MELPEFVYIAWRENDNDDPWLEATKEADALIEDDGPTTVGTYKLVELNQMEKRVISQKLGGS